MTQTGTDQSMFFRVLPWPLLSSSAPHRPLHRVHRPSPSAAARRIPLRSSRPACARTRSIFSTTLPVYATSPCRLAVCLHLAPNQRDLLGQLITGLPQQAAAQPDLQRPRSERPLASARRSPAPALRIRHPHHVAHILHAPRHPYRLEQPGPPTPSSYARNALRAASRPIQ